MDPDDEVVVASIPNRRREATASSCRHRDPGRVENHPFVVDPARVDLSEAGDALIRPRGEVVLAVGCHVRKSLYSRGLHDQDLVGIENLPVRADACPRDARERPRVLPDGEAVRAAEGDGGPKLATGGLDPRSPIGSQ
jgi:hypothetical protein